MNAPDPLEPVPESTNSNPKEDPPSPEQPTATRGRRASRNSAALGSFFLVINVLHLTEPNRSRYYPILFLFGFPMLLGGIVGMFYPLAVESFSWPAKPARPTSLMVGTLGTSLLRFFDRMTIPLSRPLLTYSPSKAGGLTV